MGAISKLVFQFMSKQARGRENLDFTHKCLNNYLQSKQMRKMKEGETYSLFYYFEMRRFEDASFFMKYSCMLMVK